MLRTLGQAGDAGAEGHVPVEDVAEVAGADDLRGIALRGVRRPDIEVVAKLRRQEPAGERQEELVQLDVLAPLHGLHVAEGVGVGLVEALLIQIARVAEEPHVHLALLALDEQESAVRDVLGAPSSSSRALAATAAGPTRKSPTHPSATQTPLSS